MEDIFFRLLEIYRELPGSSLCSINRHNENTCGDIIVLIIEHIFVSGKSGI